MLIEILIIFLRVVGHEHFRRELTRQHQACHPPRSMEAPKPHEDHSIYCLWVSGKQQHQLQFPDPFPSPEDSSTASLLLPPYLAKKIEHSVHVRLPSIFAKSVFSGPLKSSLAAKKTKHW